MKHVEFSHRNENQGVHVEFSVRRPFPLNPYSFVREENSRIQQENSYYIRFSTTKKTDTTAQLYCTLSMYVTPKTLQIPIPMCEMKVR